MRIPQEIALLNINFSFCIWLKQGYTVIGVLLLAMSITACNNSARSQLASGNRPTLANLSDTSNPSSPPASGTQNPDNNQSQEQQAVQLIHDYYDAIARRDYKQAYLAWDGDGTASKQSFEEFQQSFANIVSIVEEVGKPGSLEGAAGSLYIEIPVTVTSVTSNGTPQRFRGSYKLRRVNNVPGSTPNQRRWHIYSDNISLEQ
ncbi:MAG: hypothetical protein HWQ44_13215 [Nostoc sp. JL34]|uniref:hypothetical protein n=1 Tax=Nostoc sp. JL34 TaxID=2815397 RepID=UPI001DF5544D|nr:hypothetical protein [Nostoc sp. JL34]MBN3883898.1 hypothetical protein [Nostoc sp. JL34]